MFRFNQVLFCVAISSSLWGETPWIMESYAVEKKDAEEEEAQSVADGKTIHWKAATFAGVSLLALAAGIAAIIIDGGSSNKHCKLHSHSHPHPHQHPHPVHHR
jgi:hypothetical protein